MPDLANARHQLYVSRARDLRTNMILAELKLWAELRARQIGGVKFRRQHVIKLYIVDFYSPQMKLIIEVDGDTHSDQPEQDADRTRFLEHRGYRIVRFTNSEIYQDLAQIVEYLRSLCKSFLDPHLPPPEEYQGEE